MTTLRCQPITQNGKKKIIWNKLKSDLDLINKDLFFDEIPNF